MSYIRHWHWRVLGVLAGAVVGAAVVVSPLLVASLVATLATAILLVVVSRGLLWALALFLFVALPVEFLPVPEILVSVNPPAIIMVVLFVRFLIEGRGLSNTAGKPVVLLLFTFGGWLALTAFVSEYRTITTGWFFSYTSLVLLPALLATTETRVRERLTTVWVALAAVLGFYAIAEAFILQDNPIADALMTQGQRAPIDQVWSVYRATTILGHPVSNGAFFAIAVPLALGIALRRHSKLAALAALLSAGGVIASGTRSAFAAMLLGAAVAMLVPRKSSKAEPLNFAGQFAGFLGICTVVFLGWTYLSVRESSGEGQGSSAFRSAQVPIAIESVRDSPFLGAGPGAASFSHESLLGRIGGAGAFESYWLELVVGAGLLGLLLGALVLSSALVTAVRNRRTDIAGAVVAWIVGATFVNALEGGRTELFVLGVLLAMAFSGDDHAPGQSTRSPQHTSESGIGGPATRSLVNRLCDRRWGTIGQRLTSRSRTVGRHRANGNIGPDVSTSGNATWPALVRRFNCLVSTRKCSCNGFEDNGGARASQEVA